MGRTNVLWHFRQWLLQYHHHIIHIKLSIPEKTIALVPHAASKAATGHLFCYMSVCTQPEACQPWLLPNYSHHSPIHSLIIFSLLLSSLDSLLIFHSFWQSALQLLLPPSPYCLTAFLSFLLASCDWKRSESYWPQNSTLESYPRMPYVYFQFFTVLAFSLKNNRSLWVSGEDFSTASSW